MCCLCLGMPVVLAQEVESVLIGAAILGACASEDFASLQVSNRGGTGSENLAYKLHS